MLSVLAWCNALMIRPPHDPARKAGDAVQIIDLSAVPGGLPDQHSRRRGFPAERLVRCARIALEAGIEAERFGVLVAVGVPADDQQALRRQRPAQFLEGTACICSGVSMPKPRTPFRTTPSKIARRAMAGELLERRHDVPAGAPHGRAGGDVEGGVAVGDEQPLVLPGVGCRADEQDRPAALTHPWQDLGPQALPAREVGKMRIAAG